MRRCPICQSPKPARHLVSRSSSMYRPECRTNGAFRRRNRTRLDFRRRQSGAINCSLRLCVISDAVRALTGRHLPRIWSLYLADPGQIAGAGYRIAARRLAGGRNSIPAARQSAPRLRSSASTTGCISRSGSHIATLLVGAGRSWAGLPVELDRAAPLAGVVAGGRGDGGFHGLAVGPARTSRRLVSHGLPPQPGDPLPLDRIRGAGARKRLRDVEAAALLGAGIAVTPFGRRPCEYRPGRGPKQQGRKRRQASRRGPSGVFRMDVHEGAAVPGHGYQASQPVATAQSRKIPIPAR